MEQIIVTDDQKFHSKVAEIDLVFEYARARLKLTVLIAPCQRKSAPYYNQKILAPVCLGILLKDSV